MKQTSKSPANVVVDAAQGVRFERCTFTALGGAGLDLQNGAQSNVVCGCRFSDIGGWLPFMFVKELVREWTFDDPEDPVNLWQKAGLEPAYRDLLK